MLPWALPPKNLRRCRTLILFYGSARARTLHALACGTIWRAGLFDSIRCCCNSISLDAAAATSQLDLLSHLSRRLRIRRPRLRLCHQILEHAHHRRCMCLQSSPTHGHLGQQGARGGGGGGRGRDGNDDSSQRHAMVSHLGDHLLGVPLHAMQLTTEPFVCFDSAIGRLGSQRKAAGQHSLADHL